MEPPSDQPHFVWSIQRRIFINLFLAVAIVAISSLASLYLEGEIIADVSRYEIAQYVFVGFLSGSVGFAELVSRYRDDPRRLLASEATATYVGVNILAGLAALALVQRFDVFGKDATHRRIYEVLLASFGAIAFFRTSFFTARIGNSDVGIGPSTLLKSLLDSSDLMTNREQACMRAQGVLQIMNGIAFDKAIASLPALCFVLVEGLTSEEQKQVAEQINILRSATDIDDDSKTKILGVYLIRTVGALVLEQAVRALKPNISKP